ncbi:metallophosphoesterase family protein [Deinococcus sp.]|uniref:metallophosphoesterase family protein n=1 Tax=Deinococcus sp. TaxID=47478 RepID=UPI0025DDCE7D|nr:metallophosphoesterase family protein [Deinococcus sp.]
MRLAVLSDVHGNAFALEAVLADIQAAAPDAIYNLGDSVWGAADPGRAWEMQLEHAPPSVRGNTDEFMLSAVAELEPSTRLYREFLEGQLGGVPPELARLPVSLSVANGEVLLSHGSPRDPWEYLMFSGEVLATPAQMRERLHGAAAKVVVVGHSHTELLDTRLGISVVNAGSVSRQKYGDPAARWVLLDKGSGGWTVSFRRVEYDIEAAAHWAEWHGLDGVQEARMLRTGRR